MPSFFTLNGQLFETPTGSAGLEDPAAQLQIEILNEARTCVLYAERQTINTDGTNGVFRVQVGSVVGDGKRISGTDAGNTMSQVFQNITAINARGCAGNSSAAVAGSGRYVRIRVTPSTGPNAGLTDTLSPEIHMGNMPSSLVSETLQGLGPANFARLGTVPDLTQANLDTLFGSWSALETLLTSGAGAPSSSGNYVMQADSDSNGSGSIQFTIGSTLAAEIRNNGNFVVDNNTFMVDATSNRVGIGVTTPESDLSFGGASDRVLGVDRSQVSNGANMTLKAGGSLSGSTNQAGGDLYLASGVATGTGRSNIYLQTASPGATGTADNSPTTKMTILGSGQVGVGTTTPAFPFEVNGDMAIYGPGLGATSLQKFAIKSNLAAGAFLETPLDASNNRLNFNIGWRGGVGALSIIGPSRNIGIATAAPTASLHIRAGTAAAETAPLKLTAGPVMTTPEAGAIEFDGTNLFFTDSTDARKTIATTSGGNLTSVSSISNSSSNITLSPPASSGSVIVNSGTASVGPSSGALIVNGGVGISGAINSTGNITSDGIISSLISVVTPQIYGSTASGGSILIDGTSNAAKGNVLLATAGGNVGVGTSTPTSRLHVYQINPTNGQLMLQNNSSGSTSGIDFSGAAGTRTGFVGIRGTASAAPTPGQMSYYLWSDGATFPMIFGTANTERMRIDGSGLVGIGTSTPTANLEVVGNLKVRDATANTGAIAINTGGTGNSSMILNRFNTSKTGEFQIHTGSVLAWAFGAQDGGTGFFIGNSAGGTNSKFLIDTAGNVGIGTNTPTGTLHVNGGTAATGAGSNITINAQSAGAGNFAGGNVVLKAGSATGTGIEGTTSIYSSTNGGEALRLIRSSASTSYLSFSQGGAGNPWSLGTSGAIDINVHGARFTKAGNVGIGITDPAAKLEVYGSGTSPLLKLRSPSITDGDSVGLSFAVDSSATAVGAKIQHVRTSSYDRGALAFFTNSTADSSADFSTEKMRITDVGRVGIGTSTPVARLEVAGAIVGRAVSSATTTIDFILGNQQYTSLDCQLFDLTNLKTGASYAFAVQGTVSDTCSFNAWTDGVGSTALTVHMPPNHGATQAGTHTLYNFMVMGTHVYVSWTPGY